MKKVFLKQGKLNRLIIGKGDNSPFSFFDMIVVHNDFVVVDRKFPVEFHLAVKIKKIPQHFYDRAVEKADFYLMVFFHCIENFFCINIMCGVFATKFQCFFLFCIF